MMYVMQIENEENVLVCLRIIIEHHKQFRPSLSPEVRSGEVEEEGERGIWEDITLTAALQMVG